MRGWRGWACVVTTVALLALAAPVAEAQGVHQRTPNLSGGWTGTPGTIQLHFDHRFWLLGERIFNSPTFLVAVPATRSLMFGGHYASNSRVTGASTNEWEPFVRWALPVEREAGVALTAAYNVHSGSMDAELSLTREVSGVRLLGAARIFSDAQGRGEAGGFLGGGAVVPLGTWFFVAVDGGAFRAEDAWERIWGAGLQIRIPTTPHTLSLRAGNTRTGTLQGSSQPGRTNWGFEFTVPFTLSRYFGQRAGDVP